MIKLDVRLTEREQQVMALLAQGLGNKAIAARLGLQEKTIKHHLSRVFRKLSVKNRTEAAIAWLGLGTDCSPVRRVGSPATSGRFPEA